MRWLKRDMWKAGIAIAGTLLLLVLMVCVPVSAVGAYEVTPGLATPVTVQATPTIDATVTALNKEKLAQEVQQLKNQNEPDPLGWIRTNASIFLSTLVVVVGGLFGLWRWRVDRRDAQINELNDRKDAQDNELKDRKDEREKRAEERFQKVVEGLGSDKEEARVGAAIMLRTFLGPDYKQFYGQAFDLAVAHLRLPRTSKPPEDLTTLSQALIAVFTKAFPFVRNEWIKKRKEEPFDPQSLDASHIHLDKAFLWKADLEQVFMPYASLRGTDLSEAKLSNARLWKGDLSQVKLSKAHLHKADLGQVKLSDADLSEADLSEATLWGADLSQVNLSKADLSQAKLRVTKLSHARLSHAKLSQANLIGADLHDADLSGADLSGADLSGADLHDADLSGADLRRAMLMGIQLSGATLMGIQLSGADLSQVKLTKVQLRGAALSGVALSRDALNWDDLRRGADLITVDDHDADLSGADLRGAMLVVADLSGADLHDADLSGADLRGTNIEKALSLEGTDLRGVKGLRKEELETCKAKGASIDEDSTTSSFQSTVSPHPPSQSNDVQVPSAPSAQGSIPPPDTGGNRG